MPVTDQDLPKDVFDFQPVILRRHPLNLLSKLLWALSMFLPLIIIEMAIYASDFGSVPIVRASQWLFGGLFLIFILSFFMMQWIFWYMDVWLLTRDRLMDVQMVTFFNRRVAQMNLAQVEDVRVDTKGFLAAWFRFGDITVQSAGREGVFELRSIPNAGDMVALIGSLSVEAQRAISQSGGRMIRPTRLLGQVLISKGLISEAQLTHALQEQRRTRERLGHILIRHNLISRHDLVQALATQYNIPSMDLANYQVDTSLLNLLPVSKANKYLAIPVYRSPDNVISIAIGYPTPENLGELLAEFSNPITFLVADEEEIKAAIDRHYTESLPEGGVEQIDEDSATDQFWLK